MDLAIANDPKYQRALQFYSSLIKTDGQAVKKLRKITPLIANIQPHNFIEAELNIDKELIEALLNKF